VQKPRQDLPPVLAEISTGAGEVHRGDTPHSYVTNTNTKVSSISRATNDDALPGNVTTDFDAVAQALFSTSNVLGQMQQLDQDWATATASS
jgi:hypothetical protein